MVKVLYTGYSIREEYKEGESDLKVVDKEYVKVNGQLQPLAFTFPDTPENRKRLEDYQAAYKAWKQAEPNVFELLNNMEKLKTK